MAMTTTKRVGITGAAGFIGSHLSERLIGDGFDVVGIDDLSHGSLENLAAVADSASFRFARVDCTAREDTMRAFEGCDAIVHLAAQKIPRYGGGLHCLQANVAGMDAVANTALALGADLLVASTSDVYGQGESPFHEDDVLVIGPPTTRRWAYAVSKLYDEQLCFALAEERGLRVTVLRLFGSYGPRNHPSWWGGPQAAFIEVLLEGGTMDIHGDGQQVRTFTYVSDTVDGIVRALRTPAARGEVVNIGGTRPCTILELAELVQRFVGLAPPLRARLVPYEALPGNYQDVRRRVPSNEKARVLLKFEAAVTLEDGLAETVRWHRRRRESLV
jgi:UDP-glucose 4-epimerase